MHPLIFVSLVFKLKSQTYFMPTLHWIGKEKGINHHMILNYGEIN